MSSFLKTTIGGITLSNPFLYPVNSWSDLYSNLYNSLTRHGAVNIVLLMLASIFGFFPSLFQLASSINWMEPGYMSHLLSGSSWKGDDVYLRVSLSMLTTTAVSDAFIGVLRFLMSWWILFFDLGFLATAFSPDIVNSSFIPLEWVLFTFEPFIISVGMVVSVLRFIMGVNNFNFFNKMRAINPDNGD